MNNEDDDFNAQKDQFVRVESHDIEKPEAVDFTAAPLPTYAVAFGTNINPPPQPPMRTPSEVTTSSGLGSPLNDPPTFSETSHYPKSDSDTSYRKSEYSNTDTLPPRFRSHFSTSESSSSGGETDAEYGRMQWKIVQATRKPMRVNSASSNGSSVNPFGLDAERASIASGSTARSQPHRGYAKAGSNFVPEITTMHAKNGSMASSEKRGWVIE